MKAHVAADDGSKPITLSLGNMHNLNVFKEFYGKINSEGLYANSAYDTDEA